MASSDGRILMAFEGFDADGAYVIDEQWQELAAGARFDDLGNLLWRDDRACA